MTDSRAALDPDRLPWLTTETRAAAAERGGPPLLAWAAGAMLVVAGASYWLGRTSDAEFEAPAWTEAASETIPLPQPRQQPAAPAAPKIEPVPPPAVEVPRIEPVPPPAVELTEIAPVATPAPPKVEKIVAAAPAKKATSKRTAATSKPKARPKKTARKTAAAKSPPRRVRRAVAQRAPHWPTPAAAVPLGRIIRIGTYSSPAKNHNAWLKALNRYPQMRGLPKITGIYRKNGRTYYPLYIMTTARAQSDWICRRIRRDWRSCSVMA